MSDENIILEEVVLEEVVLDEVSDSRVRLDKPLELLTHVSYFTYELSSFIPHKSVWANIYLYDANGKQLKGFQKLIDGEDYARWGEDDDHITNVLKKAVENHI
jgi:hypothetical protein